MEILYFLKWQFNKFNFYKKMFVLGCTLFGAALVAPQPYSAFLILSVLSCAVICLLKFVIWNSIRNSWMDYQYEKERLLDILSERDM
jgi:uncharacterized membrane protein